MEATGCEVVEGKEEERQIIKGAVASRGSHFTLTALQDTPRSQEGRHQGVLSLNLILTIPCL